MTAPLTPIERRRIKEARLTAEAVRAALHYDPATGVFTRRVFNGRKTGSITPLGYTRIVVNGFGYGAHRLAFLYVHGRWPTHHLDHINCDPADNRISNLREASNIQNRANARPEKGRLLKGVTLCKGRWQAQIKHLGQNHYLGRFDTAEEANAAYAAKAAEFHGEFARSSAA